MIVLYIAQSLDGYVARENGSIDWLDPWNDSGPENVAGYTEFLEGIDYIIMGRKTYDQVLSFGKWPYEGKKCFVFSSCDIKKAPENADVARETQDVKTFVEQNCKDKRAWLLGGGQMVKTFLEANLIDEYLLTTVPVFLGKGIRLFPDSSADFTLNYVSTKSLFKGMVENLYKR